VPPEALVPIVLVLVVVLVLDLLFSAQGSQESRTRTTTRTIQEGIPRVDSPRAREYNAKRDKGFPTGARETP
jgi:hypothetical protein